MERWFIMVGVEIFDVRNRTHFVRGNPQPLFSNPLYLLNMKYIITEHQYKLLLEQDDILRIPFAAFGNNWDDLQKFLEKRGNPPYEITDDLNLRSHEIQSLGNLTSVGGGLNLFNSGIESLGNLTSVGGYLYLYESDIKSLGNLTSVGGYLDLSYCNIKSLENLTSVGGNLDLTRSKLEDLGNLTSVGGNLYLSDSNIEDLGKLKYVGGNLVLEDTPLSKKYTKDEIRSMVEVGGKIYL